LKVTGNLIQVNCGHLNLIFRTVNPIERRKKVIGRLGAGVTIGSPPTIPPSGRTPRRCDGYSTVSMNTGSTSCGIEMHHAEIASAFVSKAAQEFRKYEQETYAGQSFVRPWRQRMLPVSKAI
jgi:hypothetical protein